MNSLGSDWIMCVSFSKTAVCSAVEPQSFWCATFAAWARRSLTIAGRFSRSASHPGPPPRQRWTARRSKAAASGYAFSEPLEPFGIGAIRSCRDAPASGPTGPPRGGLSTPKSYEQMRSARGSPGGCVGGGGWGGRGGVPGREVDNLYGREWEVGEDSSAQDLCGFAQVCEGAERGRGEGEGKGGEARGGERRGGERRGGVRSGERREQYRGTSLIARYPCRAG